MAIPDIAVANAPSAVAPDRTPGRFMRAVLGNRKATAGANHDLDLLIPEQA